MIIIQGKGEIMEFFDSHSHYNDEKFDKDREEIIKSVYKEGITKILCAGYNIKSSIDGLDIAKKHDYIYSSVGISPNDINDVTKLGMEIAACKIEELANEPKVVAIGEIGLDYYWNQDNKDIQKEVFIKQIELANKLNLPIIIHTREAWQDTIDILKNQIQAINKGVFHCCPLNMELMKEALKLDYYISFAGPITFKNSKNAEEIINLVPLEKTVIETDAPYLSPEPQRGTRNDSRNLKYIADKIAKVKNVSIEEVSKITYENTKKLFKINK
jgi:TatD DNase family protein